MFTVDGVLMFHFSNESQMIVIDDSGQLSASVPTAKERIRGFLVLV